MKKATTIKEIYNTFAPEKFLTKEDGEFYVDLYEDELRGFVTALKNDENKRKIFFMAGQSGNGKSSALNLLTHHHPTLEDKYNFHYIAGRDVFTYDDIDIVDILLMIASVIIKDDEDLQKKYYDEISKLEAIKDGTLEESASESKQSDKNISVRASIGIGAMILSVLKLGVDFIASYRLNEEIRLDARRFFKVKRNYLTDLTNEIILEHKKNNNDDKDLIITIDDLEKKDNIDELFIKDMSLLNDINAIKIITMPIHLHRTNNFPKSDIREFGLKLKNFDESENDENKALLKKVILGRLENTDLITEDAIDYAIRYSGANLRQLIRLIHISAEKVLSVEGNKIDEKDVIKAKERIQRDYSSKVMLSLSFLNEVVNNRVIKNDENNLKNLAKASKMELIFARFNGDTWFELNPICEDSVKFYNKMLQK